MFGTGEREREEVFPCAEPTRGATRRTARLALGLAVGAEHLDEHAPLGKLRCVLHRLGDAGRGGFLQHDAVDDNVDEVLDLLVQGDGLARELHDLAVDANAGEAFLRKVGEELRELALAARDYGRHDDRASAFIGGEREDVVGHLVGRLLLDDTPALRAMRNAHAREEKAQVIVDFRCGAHGGARVFRGGLLVDGDRRGQAVDAVEVGLAHLAQEHTRIARKAFHIAALALSVHGVEGKA